MPLIGILVFTIKLLPIGKVNQRVPLALNTKGIPESPAERLIVTTDVVGGIITVIIEVRAGGLTVVSPEGRLAMLN